MYDPRLIDTFQRIMRRHGLSPAEFLLEITESAYTQDSEQIIDTVRRLRDMGFKIEMDDFGTGYSSLNMISTLPIDALKLDMQFIRSAFSQGKDTRLLEVIIDIADYLDVPVIAEGVETEEQLNALKAMGCDIVQGYYFSRPVPADQYERFLIERARRDSQRRENPAAAHADAADKARSEAALGRVAHALSSGFERIFYVDTRSDRYVEFSARGRSDDLQFPRSGPDFFADLRGRIPRLVCAEDQPRVAQAMEKQALLAHLDDPQPFALSYRVIGEGKPSYDHLKAVRAQPNDNRYVVIGVSGNQERAIPEPDADPLDFSSLAQVLSMDMESLYYVDIDTEDYLEFKFDGTNGALKLLVTGENFFTECQENIKTVIYPDDQEKVLTAMRKQRLLEILQARSAFTVDYRLMIDGEPRFYRLRATLAVRSDAHHLIIGVSNVDDQITAERNREAERQSAATYASIAQALAADYFSIYYVDMETDHFIEYSAYDEYAALGIEKGGEDFFNLSRRNIARVVHPDDRDKVLASFTKEIISSELDAHRTFTLAYRLMFGGVPNYVRMKATRLNDGRHIVIGVHNVDAEMQRQRESVTYGSITQALAADYFSIYYVDTNTDRFIEYSSHQEYEELNIEKSGEDFFALSRENIRRVVYPEDQEQLLAVMHKDYLLPALSQGGIFTLSYRLMMGGEPTYVHMKASRMEDKTDPHIVIGVSSIDAQVRREQEQERELATARELAHRDPLTGVKSKHAFVEAEDAWNEAIRRASADPFAVAVCDVNGLKAINDTMGHKAGDQFIRDASDAICNIFKHSPVYRVGGDEFVVLLSGQDYQRRRELLDSLNARNRQSLQSGGVIIACGASDYQPGEDRCIEAVFERADAVMYQNKTALKAERSRGQ